MGKQRDVSDVPEATVAAARELAGLPISDGDKAVLQAEFIMEIVASRIPTPTPMDELLCACLTTVSMARLVVKLADELDALKAAQTAGKN